MEQQATQRRFAVMGENLFRILNKVITNQRVCRLLKYQDDDPFNKERPDVNGLDLIHKQICIIPKIPEVDNLEMSYINIVFDKFIVACLRGGYNRKKNKNFSPCIVSMGTVIYCNRLCKALRNMISGRRGSVSSNMRKYYLCSLILYAS